MLLFSGIEPLTCREFSTDSKSSVEKVRKYNTTVLRNSLQFTNLQHSHVETCNEILHIKVFPVIQCNGIM